MFSFPISFRREKQNQMKIFTKTHKMEIEKHYTSNCEKIVKCGWGFATLSSPPSTSLSPLSSVGRSEFYYVALLLRISHFQGATLDRHKFCCSLWTARFFRIRFAGNEPNDIKPHTSIDYEMSWAYRNEATVVSLYVFVSFTESQQVRTTFSVSTPRSTPSSPLSIISIIRNKYV